MFLFFLLSFATITFVSAYPHVTKRASTAVAAVGSDFPDPAIIFVDNTWYSFGTSGNGVNIQLSSTQNFQGGWNMWDSYDVLPTLPSWVNAGQPDVWAPDVVQIASGNFVLYFTARSASNSAVHCVGTATSSSVQGPFSPSQNILACNEAQGGAIDPSGFYDPQTQKRFITYKIDGNSLGYGGSCGNGVAPIVSTPIMLQEVASDGVTPLGSPIQLLDRSDADGPLIEAPNLTILNGQYYLFFSSNCYTTTAYDVSFAVSNSVYGPFVRRGPLLVTPELGLSAPGGASVTKDGGYMVFHAGVVGARYMYAATVQQQGGTQIQICTGSGCQVSS